MKFIKYKPPLTVRTSSLDSFLTCPLKSTLPFEMDVFTSYIGHILGYAHHSPELTKGMVDVFINDYEDITGESGQELRDMLDKYVEKGEKFLEDTKGLRVYYEMPMQHRIFNTWVTGHPDVVIVHDDIVEVIDFKTAKSPGQYKGILEIDNIKEVSKAQPYIYCYFACLTTGLKKAKFSYYVYSKAKSANLHKHSVEFTFNELKEIVEHIIKSYELAEMSDMFEPKKNGYCFANCPLGPRGNHKCPLYSGGVDI